MTNSIILRTVLRCEKCGETFSDDYDRCPKCGSRHYEGFTLANPISRLPLESIIRMVGHFTWLIGTITCIAFLWNTDSPDIATNVDLMLAGFGILLLSVFLSVAMFGLAEMLKRVIRIQRRVHAMYDSLQNQGGS